MSDSDRDRPNRGSAPISAAVGVLEDHLGPIDRTETVPIEEAAGRVLPGPVAADRNLPHYRRSELDGYAVRAADTAGADEDEPVTLSTTTGPIDTGETAYVHTGSAVPEGADAVVMIETVTETGKTGAQMGDNGASSDSIEIREPVKSGAYVTPIGADLQAGRPLFEEGHRLRPGDLGTLKVAGVREVSVRDSPEVAVIPTGEELVQTNPGPGEVVETNGLVGSALVEQWCGNARYRDVVTDEAEVLGAAIERDLDADLIVTTGGSSVGSRDLLPSVVADRGELLIRGLALRPGHSASLGVVAGTPIAMLPGTPIASLVVAWLLVRPALATAVGTPVVEPPSIQATLETALKSEAGRRTVHGVTLDADDQSDMPVARSGNRGGLPSLSRIDGWVQVAEVATKRDVGETVPVERWGLSCW